MVPVPSLHPAPCWDSQALSAWGSPGQRLWVQPFSTVPETPSASSKKRPAPEAHSQQCDSATATGAERYGEGNVGLLRTWQAGLGGFIPCFTLRMTSQGSEREIGCRARWPTKGCEILPIQTSADTIFSCRRLRPQG